MRGLFPSLLERPINDRERPRLLLIIAAGLSTVALLLPSNRPTRHTAPLATRHEVSVAASGTPAPEAKRASETFLAGYLDFVYRHGSAGSIRDATGGLMRSLQAHPARVSPAMLAAHPRVLSLTTAPTALNGAVTVRAVVNDGGLVDYTVGLQLSPLAGRLLVASVEEG